MATIGSGIRYIQPDAPIPPEGKCRGRHYELMTPATLDLAERARLAVNGMTEPTDPEADYRVYWKVSFRFNPPVMYHDISDTGIMIKFMDVVPRMRLMSGSEQGLHVEQCWKEVLLHMIAPDGLVATPMEGLPYLRFGGTGVFEGEQVIDQQVNGLALGAAATFAVLDDRDFWEPIGRGIVDGLRRLVVSTGDMAYLQQWHYAPGEQGNPALPRPLGTFAAYGMWPARRLVYFYRVSGYEPALELAGRLCRYMPKASQYFGPNFEFLPDNPDPQGPRHHVNHFHHHAMTILTCLEYALASGDQQLLDFACDAFPVAKTFGECLTGFFPESVGLARPQTCLARDQTCELCEVGDMIRIAVRLAEAGLGDEYWDDADRWARNQLAEGQFLRHDWIHRLHVGDPPSQIEPDGTWPMTTDRVGERNIGAFAGWQSPNEWVEFGRHILEGAKAERLGHVQGIMHCCTANATFGLYDVWRNVVHIEGDRVKVNLLLNRAHEAVDVNSHIPYMGQVDITVKQNCALSVRMPAWVERGQVQCMVSETPRAVSFNGRYAQVGQVHADQVVQFTFPIAERTDCINIDNQRYFLVRKGHDVVCIDPPGVLCPLYQRDHYRDDVTLWKKTTRYIDEQSLDW